MQNVSFARFFSLVSFVTYMGYVRNVRCVRNVYIVRNVSFVGYVSFGRIVRLVGFSSVDVGSWGFGCVRVVSSAYARIYAYVRVARICAMYHIQQYVPHTAV